MHDLYQRPAFSTARLDRATEKREDSAWIAAQHRDAQTRYLPLWRDRCLVRPSENGYSAVLLSHDQIHPLDDSPHPPTLLGRHSSTTYFSVSVGDAMAARLGEAHQARFEDLRRVIDHLGVLDAGMLAYAKAMHYWQHRHRYCGVCGNPNRLRSAGHRMRCSNEECGRDTFPRIDPAIIVLVTHGDSCLLGRQASWPAKRYSTLAGFVEPGESLEEAVRREVYEEAGVELHDLQYRSSQPWPFPASAMAGFHARALNRHCRVSDELEDVRWFSAEQIRTQVASGELLMPTPYSIAFGLIAEWFQAQTGADPETLTARNAPR